MADYASITLGGYALQVPYSLDNRYYTLQPEIVAGRQASSCTGTLLNLGVIYKKIWQISFYPRDNHAALLALALSGGTTTFVDIDGGIHVVKFVGLPVSQPYPHSEIGLMTVVLREE